ncbi:MAG: hypothetical protein WCJ07_04560 [Verrucomicrobiota bacterium]
MKTTINTLLATIVITLTVSASSALLVETTITEHHAKGGKDVLLAPQITVESGKQASIQVNKLEYTIIPTLLDDGTVDLRTTLTKQNGKQADKLAAPRIKAKLNQAVTIQIGELAFNVKTSLAK